MTHLNFIAAGLAALGIAANLLQVFINIPFINYAALIDIINLIINGEMLSQLTGDFDMIAGFIFLVSIPVIALVGLIVSLFKKKGYIFLAVSAILSASFALYLKFVVSGLEIKLATEAEIIPNIIIIYWLAPCLWAVIYFLACMCSYISRKNLNIIPRKIFNRRSRIPEKKTQNIQPVTQKSKASTINYEALSLKEMLTEGFNALKLSDFNKADEYFTHALIRKPNSSNALIGKLMAKYKARTANELVSAPVLLETEEFFQKALLSASPMMKDALNKYIRVNRSKRG